MSQMQPRRTVSARKIVSGEISLDTYPFRYVIVESEANPEDVLTVVETEEQRGWELVNITTLTLNRYAAVLRRR
ncbi:hypothetical protein ACQHIV_16895 [Kribbella sp. GL6]|uniref:hypothetical protein n=1 Tax=Kribbella sp. GL6 TaxID=3419765 RepID=UPI003CFFC685